MATLSVDARLRAKYEGDYDGQTSEWRRLGAVGKAQNIVRLCKDHSHAKVLEIGCGDGAVLRRLAELGFGDAMWGLEISSSALEALRHQDVKTLVEARLFDGYAIPYADRQFDLAILSHVVEHVEHPRRLLDEAARVSAHVFVEVPLEDTVRLGNDFRVNQEGHINFYSRRTIRLLLQTCDLRILSEVVTNPSLGVYRFGHGERGVLKYLIKETVLRTSRTIATRLFTYHCSLLCESLGGAPS